MLVEDDASMLRYLEIVLRRANFEVTTANDGLDGMQKALTNRFDAVVADLVMPQMSGYELFRFLRHGAKPCPKLVLLSGNDFERSVTENPLADDHLLKDTHLSEKLISCLERLINQSR